MAVATMSAFVAGVVVGWIGRSVAGSSREALVEAIVATHSVRERTKRIVTEQVEWVEDLFAEGRARFDARWQSGAHIDDAVAPEVVPIAKKRGHAA